MADGVLAHIFN